jgi:hypothetical protein
MAFNYIFCTYQNISCFEKKIYQIINHFISPMKRLFLFLISILQFIFTIQLTKDNFVNQVITYFFHTTLITFFKLYNMIKMTYILVQMNYLNRNPYQTQKVFYRLIKTNWCLKIQFKANENPYLISLFTIQRTECSKLF